MARDYALLDSETPRLLSMATFWDQLPYLLLVFMCQIILYVVNNIYCLKISCEFSLCYTISILLFFLQILSVLYYKHSYLFHWNGYASVYGLLAIIYGCGEHFCLHGQHRWSVKESYSCGRFNFNCPHGCNRSNQACTKLKTRKKNELSSQCTCWV